MSHQNQRKVRAVSARPPNMRPGSSKINKLHQKTQFVENVYSSNPAIANFTSFQKNKLFSMRSNPIQADQTDLSKLIPKGQQMTRDREELFEENLHLKKEINKMRAELNKGKTKIETLTSKNSKYTKQFNREFEKKMYWNGSNSYMISGIKAQYDKLKAEFDQKEHDFNKLKIELLESRAPEFKIYAQTLQEQNKKLAERISKMAEISQDVLFDNESSIPEWKYAEMKEKKLQLEEKLEQKNLELSFAEKQVKDCRKKIEFLEKLIIEKDNNQYHATKRAKKLEREKVVQDQQVKNLKDQIDDISKNYEAKIEKLRYNEEKRFKSEKGMFAQALNTKQAEIKKLQKQVAYLSTLLTYWKPLDEINRDVGEKYGRDSEHSEILKREDSGQYGMEESKKGMSHLGDDKKIRRESVFDQKSDVLRNSATDFGGLRDSFRPMNTTGTNLVKKVRIQQTADERHSEEAEKKRKVSPNEVEHLGEYLRFRFLGLQLDLKEVRKKFDFKTEEKANFILNEEAQNNEILNEEDLDWDQEYMTMEELYNTLQQSPFELPQDDAYLLSRYMIEDSNNEHVYVDLKNEHKRMVIKSILRALVGDYEILSGDRQTQVQKQCESMMSKYQSNLLSALSMVCPSGLVTRKKFLELVNSLGIELSDEGRDFLVCKMLLKSTSLDKLNYMIIF